MTLFSYPIWVIFLAGLLGYMLGAIWYHPKVFGNTWMKAIGKDMDELGSPARAMSLTFITTMITAIALAWVFAAMGIDTPLAGLLSGLFLGLGLLATSMFSDYLFCQWCTPLYMVQAGYRVTEFAVIGLILGWLG